LTECISQKAGYSLNIIACEPDDFDGNVNNRIVIYVGLINQGLGCWRPIAAYWHGHNHAYITMQAKPSNEEWEFLPNTRVAIEWRKFDDKIFPMAVKKITY